MRPFQNLLAIAVLLVAGSMARAQANGAGPVSLVLTYEVKSVHRAAFRQYLASTGLAHFEGWKKDGILQGYELLFPTFTADQDPVTVILHFGKFSDLATWFGIERTFPGGLDPAGLELAAPKRADLADLLHGQHAPPPAGTATVTMVIPYVVTAEPARYKKYAVEYVVPQMDGWMRNGVMSGYALYLNENPAGALWSALLVLDYNGLDGFAQREVLKAKVRSELASNPVWKAWSEDKTNIRTEGHPVIAEPLNRP